jgi:RNA ligase (TIGR02306 family)
MGSEITRRLATIQKIVSLRPIPEADKIETATVLGWEIVVGKAEGFKVGDLAVYVEIDSFLPIKPEYEFLRKNCYKKYQDGEVVREGFRLKSVRLKKQLSQGLLLPLAVLPDQDYTEDRDVTEILGIIKYDPPVAASLAGIARGNFPSWIPKTDQERIQNVWGKIRNKYTNLTFEVTTKLDGSSCTMYMKDGYFGVCSRNLDLDRDINNTYWRAAAEQHIEDILALNKKNIALQGELIGHGIQDNNEKLDHQEFRVFDIWDIDNQRYFTPFERQVFCEGNKIFHVPVIATHKALSEFSDVQQAITFADGPSMNPNVKREGVVWKANAAVEGELPSFKIISNAYLLGQKD